LKEKNNEEFPTYKVKPDERINYWKMLKEGGTDPSKYVEKVPGGRR